MINPLCACCLSNVTMITKKGYHLWHRVYEDNELIGWLCQECYFERSNINKIERKIRFALTYMIPLKGKQNRTSYHNSEWKRKLRVECLTHYGNGIMECIICHKINDLTIDHENGLGKEHRKEIGDLGGYAFYAWLKEHNYPKGYRTLCRGCNSKETIRMAPIITPLRFIQSHINEKEVLLQYKESLLALFPRDI